MNTNIKLNEKIAVLAAIDPASVSTGTVVTTFVAVQNFHSISAMIQTGILGASSTIDAKFRQATDAAGTGAKDVAGKAITQLSKATGDDKQLSVELRGDDLDANNGFAFVALSVTVAGAAALMAAQVIGSNPRMAPASSLNAASVAQVV